MTPPIDIRADHLRIVQDVLRRHLPGGVQVWVFGSRATWMTKDSSDLDLALEGDGEIPPRGLLALEAAFKDSDLPYSVDVVDVKRISERFRGIVQRQSVLLSAASEAQDSGQWKDVPLGDLVDIYDGPHATPSKTRSGPVFLGISNLASGRLDLTQTEHLSEADYRRWTRRVTPAPNDIVFSYETRLGEAALIPKGLRACLGRRMGLLRPRDGAIDARFLLYAFLGEKFQDTLRERTVHGSTVDRIPLTEMADFPIRTPQAVTEQRAIAHILGTLDDKIELNRRMNATLEAMARALFRSWFVDFDPARAKMEGRDTGLPKDIADLFPDRLVNSELGETPEGWEPARLTELMEVNPKRSLPRGRVSPYVDMASMPTRGHVPESVVERPFGSGMRFVNGDTLVARITPCLENGKTAYVDFLRDGEVGWGSTEFIVLRPRSPLPDPFAYCLARSARFREFAVQNMSGTSGRQRVPAATLGEFAMASPPRRLAARFGDVARPLLERASGAVAESRVLATARDTLLPKLVSGEIRTRDAERAVGGIT